MGYMKYGNQITSDLNVVKNQLEFETDPSKKKVIERASSVRTSLNY